MPQGRPATRVSTQYCVGPGESCVRPETYIGEVALCFTRRSSPRTRSVLEAVNFAAVSPLTTAEIAGRAELNHTTNWANSAELVFST